MFFSYSDNGRAVFFSLLREFTKYLDFLGYEDFIPGDDYTVKRTAFYPEMILPVYSHLLYCCGMRPQETPLLRMEDVNL